MKEPVVVDSACLIGLERINSLDLLPALFDPILVPPEVQREFGQPLAWLQIETPNNQSLVQAFKMTLDSGESEAIALACERVYQIILDDHQARIVGRKIGLQVIGTVGVLLRAKQENIIPAINPLIAALEANGFYLSQSLKDEVLRLAGE